jgi:galactoside O-acetyltransferase
MLNLVRRFLAFMARRQILALRHVAIAPSAQVNWRGLRMFPNSRLTIGDGSMIQARVVSERDDAEILIGSNTFIGGSLIACATRIEIGDDVLIAWGCNIVDHNSHAIAWNKRSGDVKGWRQGKKDWTHVVTKPVKIGNKSWLGFNVSVLKGVEIGEGAVVAAASVVTKSVPAWTVVAGNPAKAIREIPVEDRS